MVLWCRNVLVIGEVDLDAGTMDNLFLMRREVPTLGS